LAEKTKIFIFFRFLRIFLVRIFLIIGVKPGKSSEMGEKIKTSQLGVWASGNKVGNPQFIGIFACVKPCYIVGTRGHSEKFKIKNRICRWMVLDGIKKSGSGK
jgi:hypothetical protein